MRTACRHFLKNKTKNRRTLDKKQCAYKGEIRRNDVRKFIVQDPGLESCARYCKSNSILSQSQRSLNELTSSNINMVKDCEGFTFNIIDSSCILATNLTSTDLTVLNVSGKEKYLAVTGYSNCNPP